MQYHKAFKYIYLVIFMNSMCTIPTNKIKHSELLGVIFPCHLHLIACTAMDSDYAIMSKLLLPQRCTLFLILGQLRSVTVYFCCICLATN